MNRTEASRPDSLLVVGNPAEEHVGSHFRHAAASLAWNVDFCDLRAAFGRRSFLQAVCWRLQRRPLRLGRFSHQVARTCQSSRPRVLLATGVAPIQARELRQIAAGGTILVNFLTDDPWNPVHRASWFLEALREYDFVVSPRRAVLSDLQSHGCRAVQYLPFAYAPEVHFPAPAGASGGIAPDILFIGGADPDRIPVIRALLRAGFRVALYGAYWDRCADLRSSWRGMADLPTVRTATLEARVVLGMVRHANRDGSTMRSFEVPAMKGCMLAEDTAEHREIFGAPGTTVRYFRTIDDLVRETRWMVDHPEERAHLASAAHFLITTGGHRYVDRLQRILEWTVLASVGPGAGPGTRPERPPISVAAGTGARLFRHSPP